MTVYSSWRGHQIMRAENGDWLYADTGDRVSLDPDRRCGHCGIPNTVEGHDGCLGVLPGVANACCGHGTESECWIVFSDGNRIEKEKAVAWLKAHWDASRVTLKPQEARRGLWAGANPMAPWDWREEQ